MMNQVRCAVLGCGYFGAEFARAIDESEYFTLCSVYSPGKSAQTVSAELGCPAAGSIEEILTNPEIDAVIVATPNYLHKEHVLAAAAAGKHIFCEKPFALNVEDAKQMVAACQKAGVMLMVGHIMHFYSGIRRVKEMIEAGKLGRLMSMHVERTGWEHQQVQISWKKMQDKSGGHLFHHIHEIDIAQWLMGKPVKLYGVGGNLGHCEEGFGNEDDVLLITASFENGGFATFQYGSGFRLGDHFIRINASEAGVLIDFKNASVFVHKDDDIEEFPLFSDEKSAEAIRLLFARTDGGIAYGNPDQRPPEYILVSLREELNAFRQAIVTGSIPDAQKDLFDGTSACRSVEIAQYALESRMCGKAIDL